MVFQWERVRCDGNENKLSQCTHDVQHKCEVADKDVAGVKCQPSKIYSSNQEILELQPRGS